jgi:hypothetical protein
VRRPKVVVILFSGCRVVLTALARPILVRPILIWLCLTRIYLPGISLVRSTLTRVSLIRVTLIGIILSTLAGIALTTTQIVTHVTFRFKHDAECAESKDQLAQQAFGPSSVNTGLLFAESNKRDKKRVPCGFIPPTAIPNGPEGVVRGAFAWKGAPRSKCPKLPLV